MAYRDGLPFRGKAWVDARNSEEVESRSDNMIFFVSRFNHATLFATYNCLLDIITSTYFVTSCAIASAWLLTGIAIYLPCRVRHAKRPTYPSYTSEPERCWETRIYRVIGTVDAQAEFQLQRFITMSTCVRLWCGGEVGGLLNAKRDYKHARGTLRPRSVLLLFEYLRIFLANVNFFQYLISLVSYYFFVSSVPRRAVKEIVRWAHHVSQRYLIELSIFFSLPFFPVHCKIISRFNASENLRQ